MPRLRAAILALAMAGLTAMSQTPPPANPPQLPPATPAPAGTVPAPKAAYPAMPKVSPTQVAVTVNTEPIYEVAVQRALERVPPARRTEARASLIDYLVDNLLIDQSLRAAGYQVPVADIDKRVVEMKGELKKVGKDFDRMLAEFQTTEAELRNHIGADLRWVRYASTQATDKAVQDFFVSNKEMFDGSSVRARHILITPPTKDEKAAAAAADQLRQIKKAVEGEVAAAMAKLPPTADKLAQEKARGEALADSFGKYAKAKSDCPTKERGGDVNWFQKVGYMVQPFSDAAFRLPTNQISDPVQTPFGYHLILVTERRPGRDVKFEEAKEAVKEVYFERLREGLAAQLRKKAAIKVEPTPR
ncbi:MAG: peptidylprolyl isomerase [Gemmataceae bacterium]